MQIEFWLTNEQKEVVPSFIAQEVSGKKEIAIIGAGPAGLYAALRAIEAGLKPIVFERGKDVRSAPQRFGHHKQRANGKLRV